jgi:hypothetical protein
LRITDSKEFKRNGKHICYTIAHVEPLNETEPAFLYAQHRDVCVPQQSQRTLGHRWRYFDCSNLPPIGDDGAGCRDYPPGTKELAQQVASEVQAIRIELLPALADIMDAMLVAIISMAQQTRLLCYLPGFCEKWVESAVLKSAPSGQSIYLSW